MLLAVWIGFILLVLGFLALDLGVFHRAAHAIGIRESLTWTAVWIILALAFNALVYFMYGHNWFGWSDLHAHELTGQQAAVQFFTGYLLEKSLSVDNIFVIAMIFTYFGVPLEHQHRVLFWGILGAIVLRGLMIGIGTALMARFDWITYLFGLLLFGTSIKLLITRHDTVRPERNLLIRLARKLFRVTDDFDGSRFFTTSGGRRAITPLFLALLLVESTDVLFAVDSIPAIFAVTSDPFIVFTSNVFAILGLRMLYFALAGLMHRFRYVKMSLVFILAYVGVKIMLTHHHPIPNLLSLAVIVGLLAVGVIASIVAADVDAARLRSPLELEKERRDGPA
jgi:tellurite resistance protein TerC